jgi:hypothetical protein
MHWSRSQAFSSLIAAATRFLNRNQSISSVITSAGLILEGGARAAPPHEQTSTFNRGPTFGGPLLTFCGPAPSCADSVDARRVLKDCHITGETL